MNKVRVYELARDLKIESKLLVNTLKSIGVSVASHQSSISDEDVEKVKRAITGQSAAPASTKTAATRPAAGGSVRVSRRRRGDGEQAGAGEGAPTTEEGG